VSAPATPLRAIELSESSGPVSPRFRWSIHLTLDIDERGGELLVETRGTSPSGTPPSNRRQRVEAARIESLWRALESEEVREQGGDLIGALRSRVGVSFNHLRIALVDGPDLRFDYLLSQLDVAENAHRRAIVAAIKELAGV
jgi:hypothetical protein